MTSSSSIVSLTSSGVVTCSQPEEDLTYKYTIIAPNGNKIADSQFQIIVKNCSDIENCGKCSVSKEGKLSCIEWKYSDYELDTENNSCSQVNITKFTKNSIVVVQGVIGVSIICVKIKITNI